MRNLYLSFLLFSVLTVSAQDSLRVVTLSEVVATGTRSETDPRLLPMTVSVVGDSVLSERQETNILPTLVDQVPGLFVTQRGVMGYSVSTGGSGGIKVRGIGGYTGLETVTFQIFESINKGDVNSDGRINIKDVTAIQRHVAELELLTGEALLAAARPDAAERVADELERAAR